MPFARAHIFCQLSTRTFVAAAITVIGIWSAPARAQSPTGCETGTAEVHLDVNDMRARILNNGGLFWNGTRSDYRIVRPDTINLVFSTSLVVGGMVDGELRAAGSTYGPWEFWPGPVPEGDPSTWDCEKYDRIWMVKREDLHHLDDTGFASKDIDEWPWDLGAPVIDGDGITDNYDLQAGDRPEVLGDQTAWWVMNDAAGVHEATGSRPIGLEVRGTAFSLLGSGVARRSTFYRYRMTNRSVLPLDSAWVGLVVDPDLGAAFDDYVGSDTTLGMGYVYNRDAVDESLGESVSPPAVGYVVLDSPGRHIRKNHPDGTFDRYRSTFMTSFLRFNNGGGVMGHPQGASDFYNYLQARWRDGQSITVGGEGRNFSTVRTTFMYPADPPEFWSEYCRCSDYFDGSDRRFILGSGPFSLAPGESTDFTFAIVYGQGKDHLDSVQELKQNARFVKDAGQLFLKPSHSRETPERPPRPASHSFLGVSRPWPNPASRTISVRVDLPESRRLRIALVNTTGREVALLHDQVRPIGRDILELSVEGIPPGAYFLRAQVGSAADVAPLIVVR